MRIRSEDEILKPEVRKKLIEEIVGSENVHRKNIAFKRWSIWKTFMQAAYVFPAPKPDDM